MDNKDINEFKEIISSGKSFVNGVSMGFQFKWIISSIPNHIADKTIEIDSFEKAAQIINLVEGSSVSPKELENKFLSNLTGDRMYLHLGAYR